MSRQDEVAARNRPGRFRRWVVRTLLWGLAVLAVAAFLLQLLADSPRGREWARSLLEAELSARLDHQVTIGRVSFVLLPFTLQVWDLRIAGGPADGGQEASGRRHAESFLWIPHAVVDLDLDSLGRRRAHVRRLRLERPEVRLEWYRPRGDNIVERAGGPVGDGSWQVWIDRVEIDRARVFLDHERIDLSVAGNAVRTRLRGRGPGLLDGQVAAQGVEVRLPGAEPLVVAVAAAGSIRRGHLDLGQGRIRRPGLSADFDGGCVFERERWAERKCTFRTTGTARGEVLGELGYFRHLRGDFDFDGEMAWRPDSSGWRGRVHGRQLRLWQRELTDLEGVLAADRFVVRLDLERARYAGGSLGGSVEVAVEEPGRPLAVALHFEDQRLDELLADQRIPVRGVASRLSGRFRYRCLIAGAVDCDRGDGRGEMVLAADPDHPGLPERAVALEGSFPVRVESGIVRADTVRAFHPEQSVLAAGWYDLATDRGAWSYEIETADVGRLLPLLPLADPEQAPSWLPEDGEGQIRGRLDLGPAGPTSELELRLEDVVTPRLATALAAGSLFVDTAGLRDLRLDLGDAEHRLRVEGDVPFAADATLALAFEAFRWPMAAVRPWLDDLPLVPLDGDVTGTLALRLAPDGSSGTLDATLEPAVLTAGPDAAVAIELQALATRFTWADGRMDVESLDLRSPAGVVSGAGWLRLPGDDQPGQIDLGLSSSGLALDAAPLAAWRPRDDLHGIASLDAHLGGSFRQPELELRLLGRELRLGDRPLDGESRLDAVWNGRQLGGAARFADVLVVEGGGDLDLRRADLVFTVTAGDLAALLEAAGAPSGVGGQLAGELRIDGPTGNARARLVLDQLDLELAGGDPTEPGRRLRNRMPVVLLWRDGVRVEQAELFEDATGSRMALAGKLVDPLAPVQVLDLMVDAELDAGWLRALVLPDLPLEGRLAVAGRLAGPAAAPRFDGSLALHDGSLEVPGMPQDVQQLEGTIQASGDQLTLDGVRGRFAGGNLRLGGSIVLPSTGAEGGGSYRLTLDADDIDLRHPDGWSVAGRVALVAASTTDGGLVSGRADLARLGWTQDLRFELSEMLRELFRRRKLEVAAGGALADVALNVQLLAPAGTVRVDNNLASLTGSADLFLRGNLAAPVLYGEVSLDGGGTLVYNGIDYVVERGRILFVDPYDLKAEIDLVATTRVRDFDVTLAAFGSLERLETRFRSDPPLPDVELFRLLAGGEVVGTEAELLDPRLARLVDEESTSAAGFLYGQAASAIGDRVSNLFGLDKFRIDPLTGSDRDNLSKARVTVGKRLSKDVFVTYSVDPSSSENQRLQIEWRVAEGLTLVLTQNGDNTYSADARWDSTF